MVFVTGGTGFTGSWLICNLLSRGENVRALKRAESSLKYFMTIYEVYFQSKKILDIHQLEWVEGDLMDIFSLEDAIENCDMVFHAAALVSFHKKDEQALNEVNVIGTKNIINAMLYKGIKKIAYISSTAAIGKTDEGIVADENTPWKDDKNQSIYAKTKHKAELEVFRGIEEGLTAYIVNPGIISGFGDWNRGSCATYKKIYRGLTFYSLGENGVVDVRDVCKALLLLVDNQIKNERFLLISENISYQNYFNLIAKGFNKPLLKYEVKKWLGHLIARTSRILENLGFNNLFVTKEIALSAVSIQRYSSEKIIQKLSYNFISVSESTEFATSLYLRFKDNM